MKFQRVLESLQVFRTRQIRDRREITCRAFFSHSEDSPLRTFTHGHCQIKTRTYDFGHLYFECFLS